MLWILDNLADSSGLGKRCNHGCDISRFWSLLWLYTPIAMDFECAKSWHVLCGVGTVRTFKPLILNRSWITNVSLTYTAGASVKFSFKVSLFLCVLSVTYRLTGWYNSLVDRFPMTDRLQEVPYIYLVPLDPIVRRIPFHWTTHPPQIILRGDRITDHSSSFSKPVILMPETTVSLFRRKQGQIQQSTSQSTMPRFSLLHPIQGT